MSNDELKTIPPTKFLGVRVSACFEILIFFCFLFLFALLFHFQFNFFTASPHPFWILVILISAQYGTVEGLVAATISTMILLIGPLPEHTILQDKFEYFFLIAKIPLLWFVTAVILGELRMKHIRERDRYKEEALHAAEKEKKIAEAYSALKSIKERLEIHIASEMQTTLMAMNAFNKLESSGREGIIQGACDLTTILVAPEAFSIFLLQQGELKRVAFQGWTHKDLYLDQFQPGSALYQEVIANKRVVALKTSPEVLGNEGVLAVPIMTLKTHEVLGMIKVEQMPFLLLRTSTIECLRIVGEWVGTAYANYLNKNQTE